MNRKAIYVRLQTPLSYPGVVGELGAVLPPQNKQLPELEMTWYGADGLVVAFNWLGVKRELAIPSSNVVLLSLAPELRAVSAPKTDLKVVVKAS